VIREHLKGHTQALEDLAIEMLARRLSVRDIEDAFKDESGRLLLSRTAVSERRSHHERRTAGILGRDWCRGGEGQRALKRLLLPISKL